MPQSFFEFLAIADQERIHSQMLAWMLSPSQENAPLDAEQRRRLLLDVFNFEVTALACETLRVKTELKQIDIVVLADGNMLVIENKLKSRQSQGQLARYTATIEAFVGNPANGVNGVVRKCFLTFSGEQARQDGWQDVDYRRLHSALDEVNPNSQYVRDYASMLGRLLDNRDDFLGSHTQHSLVFARSGMSNEVRLAGPSQPHESGVERFTFDNRLERIFYEALLMQVGQRLDPGVHLVNETRGQALIDTRLFTFGTAAGIVFNCGLQLQGRSVKLTVGAADLSQSDRAQILALEAPLDAAIAGALGDGPVARNRRPAPRRAFRSWSYTLADVDLLERNSITDFVAAQNCRIEWARDTWACVLDQLGNVGTVQNVEAQVMRQPVELIGRLQAVALAEI